MQTITLAALLWLATMVLPPTARAQGPGDAPRDTARWTTGATQLRIGSARLGLDRLNEGLAQNHRPTFSNTLRTFGLSTYARRGRLIAGASVEGSLPHRTADESWTTKLSANMATLDGGYVVLDRSRFMVSTSVSLGLRTTSLHFERRGDFSYDDGLEDPARGVDLLSRSGVTQVGLSVERQFDAHWPGTFALVVQTGMMRPFGGAATFAGESHVARTPAQDGGSYLRIAFAKPIAHRGRALDTVVAALASSLLR